MKILTHNVQVPPLTDQQEMLGAYRTLFDSLCVPHTMPFEANPNGFSHPIEAENAKLSNDFFNTMMVVRQLLIDRINVQLTNVRVSSSMVTFVFSYEES